MNIDGINPHTPDLRKLFSTRPDRLKPKTKAEKATDDRHKNNPNPKPRKDNGRKQ